MAAVGQTRVVFGLSHTSSAAELCVSKQLSQGVGIPRIAREIHISVETVRTHTGHVFRKFGSHDRVEATRTAEGRRM